MGKIHDLCTVEASLLKGNIRFRKTLDQSRTDFLNMGYEVKAKEEKYVVLHGWFNKAPRYGFIQETIFLFDEDNFLDGVINRKYDWDNFSNFNNEPQISFIETARLHSSVLLNFAHTSKKLGITFDPQEKRISSWGLACKLD